MSIDYSVPFIFTYVLTYLGENDNTSSILSFGAPYLYYSPNEPTNETEYLAGSWTDDRIQPTWAYVIGEGFDLYKANYYATPATLQDIVDLRTLEDANVVDSVGKCVDGITARSGSFPIFKSETVSSGVAVFHLTDDGLSTGAALFENGVIEESIMLSINDSANTYQMSSALSNSNKTLTVTANKLTTADPVSGVIGQVAADGAVVRLNIQAY